jgi:nesprin-1
LSGLTSIVSELEEGERQRAALQQWITEQNAVVADWRSKPAKLRPEAARAELVNMHEMLGAVGERRARLVTELPVTEEGEPKLEEQLNKLETEVCAICLGSCQSITKRKVCDCNQDQTKTWVPWAG